METKKLKPTSNGVRHQLNIKKALLSKSSKLVKSLLVGTKNVSGRSASTGRITVRHKGAGLKNLYRKIEFNNSSMSALALTTFYDPSRTSFCSLNFDLTKKVFFQTLATSSVGPGSLISRNNPADELRLGCRFTLDKIPAGSLIHSISEKNSDSKYVRSAGGFAQLIQKGVKSCKIKLPSGKIMVFSSDSYATLGTLSNKQHNLVVIGKAGRRRLKGVRPSVRGIAMNPVDHPHGGRTNGGMPSVTPWGIPTKGKPTVLKKNKNYE
jgi:large subunit ribosomal protein L2